jgi:hypothetical protein
MASERMKLSLLHDPFSSDSGKFYIGIEDIRFPATIYGAKTANNSGRLTRFKCDSKVIKKIKEKLHSGYRAATVYDIPVPTMDKIRRELSKTMSIPEDEIDFTDTHIILGALVAITPQAAHKPRRRKSQKAINVWI